MNTNRNKVISVFSRGSANNLYYEFLDNEGKKKQKSIGSKDTESNRKKAWKMVSEFEKRLVSVANEKKEIVAKKEEHPLNYYGQKYIQSLVASGHTKAAPHASRVNKLIEYFGKDTLPADITELDIEEFFEQLPVSRDTKNDWKVVLTAMFEKARKDKAISVNIAKQFTLPISETQNTPDTVRMPYSQEEAQKLIDNADRRLRNYLGIAFNLGLRPEETLGLMEQDIDFEKETLFLKRAVVNGRAKPITKHKGGERDVPLFMDALPFIRDQLAWAKEKNSLYLFFNDVGNRLNDSIDIRGEAGKGFYWKRYLDELNIVPQRRMMNTRHTFAIHCIRNMDRLGFTLNDIASMMGHTSLRMLLSHYGKYMNDKNKTINRGVSIFEKDNASTCFPTCFSENASC